MDDLDLNLDEFVAKVNSDLVGKVVNLASRTAKFVEQTGPVRRRTPTTAACSQQAAAAGDEIAAAYEACDYNRAMRLIMALADRANPYVEDARAVEAAQGPGAGPASCRTSARWR